MQQKQLSDQPLAAYGEGQKERGIKMRGLLWLIT